VRPPTADRGALLRMRMDARRPFIGGHVVVLAAPQRHSDVRGAKYGGDTVGGDGRRGAVHAWSVRRGGNSSGRGAGPAGWCGTLLRAHHVSALTSTSRASGGRSEDDARRRHRRPLWNVQECRLLRLSMV
jgi:hypothetical protein